MSTVNITNLSNTHSIYDMVNITSEATGGNFFGIMLIVFFGILVMNFRNQGMDRAIAGACFICLMLSLILLYLSLIQILYPIIFGVGLAATLAIIFWTSP